METTKPISEAFNDSAKVIEKLFNTANATMTELYKKQMDLTSGFYNNLLNSSSGNTNGWNQNNGFPNMFTNMDITKWFSNPFTNFSATAFQNPFLAPIDKTMKQIMDFNQNMLSTLTGGIQGKETNWGTLTDEYKGIINARLEASKEILNIITDAFNKQLESSGETNKKTLEEVNNQFNSIMKQNQKLWSDLLKAYQVPLTGEEKKDKDNVVFNENKKRSNVAVS